jgi:hypothetical protein
MYANEVKAQSQLEEWNLQGKQQDEFVWIIKGIKT